MKSDYLKTYLSTRRMGWPYEGSYKVERLEGYRFIARIGDELAGLSYADVIADDKEAVMKMNLKSQFAEYGIGTELLHLLMNDLKSSGYEIICYEIPAEYYAYQIYKELEFTVESRDEETIRFVWRKHV